MLIVPLQASASHNSFGTRLEITRGDEVNPDNGNLAPDIAEGGNIDEKANVYHLGFTEENDLPARPGPVDQSGAFYDPGQCTPYEDFAALAEDSHLNQKEIYEAALPGTDVPEGLTVEENACWVGYLDNQKEYAFAVTAIGNPTSDSLYFLNPELDDEDCQHGDYFLSFVEGGEERREGCGSPPGRTLNTGVVNPEIDPFPGGDASHDAWWPGSWHSATIDTDLIEATFAGDDGTNCQEATCNGVDVAANFEEDGRDFHGSGTLTIPLPATSHTFLFGYPHPDNDASEDYAVGPADEPFSQPLWGVPDAACGVAPGTGEIPEGAVERIPRADCQLLGPADLEEYDVTFDEGLEGDEKGRLCSFSPDTGIQNPDGLSGGPCGLFGTRVETFIEEANAGGFGTGAETYQSSFPGWRNPLLDPSHAGTDSLFWTFEPFGTDNTTGQAGIFHDDYDDQRGATTDRYFDRGIFAVNPKVPQVDDTLSCLRPNILADGQTVPSGTHEGENAPGMYGTYQAAAIDVDIYIGGQNSVLMGGAHDGDGVPGYEGYHETVGEELETVDQTAGQAFSTADDLLGQASGVVDEATPDETPADEIIEDVNDTLNETLDTASTASNRLGPTETSDPEPSNELGEDNWDYRTLEIPEGVSCQAGILQFDEDGGTEQGVGLRMDSTVSRQTTTLKDPTILDEENLPAREDDTTDGTWNTDSYSFSTSLFSFVDENLDGSFSGCAPDDGAPSPNQDSCPWTGTWDAYNPTCTGSEDDKECEELLRADGYAVTADDRPESNDDPYGVGAVATLEVSGTTLLWTTDRGSVQESLDEWTLVNQDPAQSTCVILTSNGFSDKLATHVGDDDTSFGSDEEAALCPDHDSESIEVWHDAFADQQGLEDDGLSAILNWAKLSPTPDAVRESMEMADDRLCLSFVFSTASDRLAENTDAGEEPGVDGTKGNIQLGADSTTTYYTDCDVLTSYVDEDGEPDDGHPLDGKSLTFPVYS